MQNVIQRPAPSPQELFFPGDFHAITIVDAHVECLRFAVAVADAKAESFHAGCVDTFHGQTDCSQLKTF